MTLDNDTNKIIIILIFSFFLVVTILWYIWAMNTTPKLISFEGMKLISVNRYGVL